MQVSVRVLRHVVVEDYINSFYIHASAKYISGHKDSPLEIFKLLISCKPLLLLHSPVDCNGWEILLHQELCQCYTPLHRLYKDDHL